MDNIGKLIPSVLRDLQSPEKNKISNLLNHWEAIAGKNIAAKSKPYLGREGKLTVWVESSALAYELSQRYRQSFLKRAQAVWEKMKSSLFTFELDR